MRKRTCHRATAGFTILEVMIAIGIAIAVMAVLLFGMRRVRKSELRETTMMVANALRSARNLAMRTSTHHRVVFDLDGRTVQLQACEPGFKLRKERLEELDEKPKDNMAPPPEESTFLADIQQAQSPEEAAKRAMALAGDRLGSAQCGEVKRRDGTVDKRSAPWTLAKTEEIRVERVYVQHREDVVTEGKATVNFFGLGRTEKAVIELTDGEDGRYTLLVHSMTGRVDLKGDDWGNPDDHMQRNAVGEAEEER